MDKELLRIAIIGTGLIIMVVMIVSAYLKNRQDDEDEYEEYEDEFDEDEYEDDDIEEEPVKKPSLAQTLRSAYSQTIQKAQQHQKRTSLVKEEDIEAVVLPPEKDVHLEKEPAQRKSTTPAILQFSVITKPGDDDFNVADVFHVLEGLDLEYGSMKIFERVDEDRFVHFGVANMVEPGTFPDENVEEYYCPGVVFFMQVDGLKDPKSTFDDYVATAMLFAQEMDGVVLDHRRQPLTDQMVDAIRAAM